MVYCGVLRCTAVYCGVLRCTAVYCGILRCTVVYCGILWSTCVPFSFHVTVTVCIGTRKHHLLSYVCQEDSYPLHTTCISASLVPRLFQLRSSLGTRLCFSYYPTSSAMLGQRMYKKCSVTEISKQTYHWQEKSLLFASSSSSLPATFLIHKITCTNETSCD